MSEILNDNSKQVSGEDGSWDREYPAYDRKVAEEARRQAIAEYEATHPDAVKDVEKARFMARAEDPYREKAKKLWTDAENHRGEAEELYLMANEEESLGDSDPNNIGRIKRLTNRERVWAKQIRQSAKGADSAAAEAGDKAGAFYDSLHED